MKNLLRASALGISVLTSTPVFAETEKPKLEQTGKIQADTEKQIKKIKNLSEIARVKLFMATFEEEIQKHDFTLKKEEVELIVVQILDQTAKKFNLPNSFLTLFDHGYYYNPTAAIKDNGKWFIPVKRFENINVSQFPVIEILTGQKIDKIVKMGIINELSIPETGRADHLGRVIINTAHTERNTQQFNAIIPYEWKKKITTKEALESTKSNELWHIIFSMLMPTIDTFSSFTFEDNLLKIHEFYPSGTQCNEFLSDVVSLSSYPLDLMRILSNFAFIIDIDNNNFIINLLPAYGKNDIMDNYQYTHYFILQILEDFFSEKKKSLITNNELRQLITQRNQLLTQGVEKLSQDELLPIISRITSILLKELGEESLTKIQESFLDHGKVVFQALYRGEQELKDFFSTIPDSK